MKEKERSRTCWPKKADIIIRFQGGANAGHTIVNDYGKFALHTTAFRCFLRSYDKHHRKWRGVEYPGTCSKEIKSIVGQRRSGAEDSGVRPGADRDAVSYYCLMHMKKRGWEENPLALQSRGLLRFIQINMQRSDSRSASCLMRELLKGKGSKSVRDRRMCFWSISTTSRHLDPEDLYETMHRNIKKWSHLMYAIRICLPV